MALVRAPSIVDLDGPTRAVVLLVDAQPRQRRELAERLGLQRCWAIAAADVTEAYEILKAIRPSLVLIRDASAEARMLANRVRADASLAQVAVLALPGLATPAVEAHLWATLEGSAGDLAAPAPRRRQR